VFVHLKDEVTSAKLFLELNDRNRANVRKWREVFEHSLPSFQDTRLYGRESSLGLAILRMDHAMTSILADMCLEPDNVMAYDRYTKHFITIVTCAQDAVNGVKEVHMNGDEAMKPYRELFTFVPEGGWSSPMFFTALNCRIRRLRHHAIRFLQSVSTQDFIWNHKIAADISEDIMDLEHGDGFDASEDNYDLMAPLREQDMRAPDVPRERRIDNVKIELRDSPRKAIATYTKTNDRGERELIVREYDFEKQRPLLRSEDALNTVQNVVGNNALLNYDSDRTRRSLLAGSSSKGSIYDD
jgi:hypothetical protein